MKNSVEKQITFSDECKINLKYLDSKCFVWRKQVDAFNPKFVYGTFKYGGASITI